MKYICSLSDNYEVIGICDIKTFNEKISEFTDNSWTQINIAEKLNIPSNKLPIKNILKIKLSIKINSTRIIKSCSADFPNIEGLKITGKVLLVSGIICEYIIYNSDKINNSIYTINFNIPFSDYIVIDEDSSSINDFFHVYKCIENVFIKLLDEETLMQNMKLFLFAHRIEGIREKLKNSFIFKTQDSNEEMAKVEFDIDNNKLIVTSSGKSYNNPNIDVAFKFELKNSDESINKTSAIINGNGYANDFKNKLKSKIFEFGDIIILTYDDSDKVILTDYPDVGDTYRMNNPKTEKFLITSEGIIPILASNKIIVKSRNNEVVLTIEFLEEAGKLIVSSKGVIPDPISSDLYFTLILKNRNGQDIIRATLNANEDGASFKAMVNDTPFEYDYNSLTLVYKEKNNIEILNYPTQGNDYIPPLDFNIFKIKADNLEDIGFKSKIKIINFNNQEMSSLYFFKPVDPILINNGFVATIVATSTKAISTNSEPNKKYVQYVEYSKENPLMYTEILTQSNAENFKTSLDGENIKNNQLNVLRLSNRLNDRIIITNYNTQNNQIEYTVGEEPEFINIKNDNLSKHSLNYNKIRLKNIDGESVLFIYFDKLDRNNIYIESYSTGTTNSDSNFFSFKITDSVDETNIKVQGIINRGEAGDVIKIGTQPYNISKDFNFGDLLILEYSNGNLVEVFDFPESKNVYNPLKNSQKFMITENGLSINKFITNFVFKTHDSNKEMAKVEFDSTNKRLIVTSTGEKYNNPNVATAFTFELKHSHLTPPKISSTINGNGNADNFKNTLDVYEFEFGDVINIIYDDSSKVVLNNYPNIGNIHNMTLGSKDSKFLITSIGVLPILNPKIIVKAKDNNRVVLTIQFMEETEKFIVTSSGLVADSTSSEAYLTFILKDKDGTDVIRTELISNENGDSFKSKVNDKTFKPDEYTLTLIYKEKDNIDILDYPTRENIYTPKLDFNIFRIRANNIEDAAFNNTIKIINDINQEMSKLYFIKPVSSEKIGATIVTTSTMAVSTSTGQSNKKYIDYLQYYSSNYEDYQEILTKESALKFSTNLDGRKIEPINAILRFSNRFKDRIIITNYNNENEYKIGEEPEFIDINNNNLRKHPLNYNTIKFKNIDNSVISYIYFDKISQNNIYIEFYSTGVTNNDSTKLSFKITDLTETNIKVQGTINKGETGDLVNFGKKSSNISNNFDIGDLLTLEYSNGSLVEISDFPESKNTYNPSKNSQKFIITSNGLSVNKFITNFVFKTHDSNKEMGKIEFDSINKRLIVTSTGESYNNPNVVTAFNFILKNSDESSTKISKTIGGNENADDFKNVLNGYDFEVGDVIDLTYQDSSKVVLNNYPNTGDIYDMSPDVKSEKFIITSTGITPIIHPVKIVVKSKKDEEVLRIQFSRIRSEFIVFSTGVIPDSSSTDSYLNLTLTNSNGTSSLDTSLISNENGSNFKNYLNNRKINFGDNRLVLAYKDESKIEIVNYPKQGERYTPDFKINIFEVTDNNLIDKSFNSKIKIFSDDNKEVALISFGKFNTIKLLVMPTDIIASQSVPKNIVYVQFLQYTNSEISVSGQIFGKENAYDFASDLNSKTILESYPIKLSIRTVQKAIITNYRNELSYRVGEEPEFFKISGDNLIPYKLFYDKIKFKNMDGKTILYIHFDKINEQIYMLTHATGVINKNSDTFSFRIPDKNPTIPVKIQGLIRENQTGDVIKLQQGSAITNISKDIAFDDVIEFIYTYSWLVEVVETNESYPLTGTSQKFTITKDALVTSKLKKTVIDVNSYNSLLTNISFNTTSKTLRVTYNTTIAEVAKSYYILLEIKDKNGVTKHTSRIFPGVTAFQFASAMNGKNFEYEDVLDMSYEAYNYKITIHNYPREDDNSHPYIQKDSFKITKFGLDSYYRYLKNTILFTGYTTVFAMLRFNINTKRIDIKGYAWSVYWLYHDFVYYYVVLKGRDGGIKRQHLGNGSSSGASFQNSFDGQSFEFGDSIVIKCAVSGKIKVSNYPVLNRDYYTDTEQREFRITENGLYLI